MDVDGWYPMLSVPILVVAPNLPKRCERCCFSFVLELSLELLWLWRWFSGASTWLHGCWVVTCERKCGSSSECRRCVLIRGTKTMGTPRYCSVFFKKDSQISQATVFPVLRLASRPTTCMLHAITAQVCIPQLQPWYPIGLAGMVVPAVIGHGCKKGGNNQSWDQILVNQLENDN